MLSGETPEDLLRACSNLGDWRAWERFICIFNPLIVTSVLRVAREYGRPDLRDDLVQEVYLKLSANGANVLRGFISRHVNSVFGYVQIIAFSVARDYFKRKANKPAIDDNGIDASNQSDDGASESAVEWTLLLSDVEKVLEELILWKKCTERDRLIFWLYYRQGLSAKNIAALPAFELEVKGVEAVIYRVSKLVRKAFKESRRGTDARVVF